MAEQKLKLGIQNLINADTLLKTTEKKFSIGTRDLNDLLQARLNLLDAQSGRIADSLNYEKAKQDFILFFNLTQDVIPSVEMPVPTSFFFTDITEALKQANKNRKEIIDFRLKRLYMEMNLKSTKASFAPTLSLSANIGTSQSAGYLLESYQNLQQQQSLAIQLNLPISTWGLSKAKIKKAQTDLDIVKLSIKQDSLLFIQEVTFHVMNWNKQRDIVNNTIQAKQISEERFSISKQRYILGTINFTEFSTAQQQMINGQTMYLMAFKNYWLNFYLLRRLTLYDFETNKPL